MSHASIVAEAFPESRLVGSEREVSRAVGQWLDDHREEFLDDLCSWITVPSVARPESAEPGAPFGSDVAAMMDLAASTARKYGLRVETHDGYALSILGGASDRHASGADEIGLVSHVDVVPAGDGWRSAPFVPERQGDRLVGRGAWDNKGPALVNLYVLRALRDLEIPIKHGLRLILGGCEEVDMSDMHWYAQRGQVPAVSLVTDAAFGVNYGQKGVLTIEIEVALPDGSPLALLDAGAATNSVPGMARLRLPGGAPAAGVVNAAVVNAAADDRGWGDRVDCVLADDGSLEVVVRGVAGHAAMPDGTVNAVTQLLALLSASEVLESADHVAAETIARVLGPSDGSGAGLAMTDESGPLTVNLGRARPHGGGLRLGIDVRYPMTSTGDEVLERLAAALREVGVVADVSHLPAYHVPRDSDVVRLLQGAFNDALGTDREPFTMGGGTHSKVLPRAITFGVDFWYLPEGEAAVDAPPAPPHAAEGGPHTANEAVSVSHLLAAGRILVTAAMRLDVALEGQGKASMFP